MADDEDLYKGPLAERVQSKNWKVRRAAFEELQQKFKEATDNAIFDEYAPKFKKIIEDKNAAAQEKGLDALLAWIDRAENPTKLNGLCQALAVNCFGGRANTVQKAIEALLLFIEVDRSGEAVIAALLPECFSKQWKISSTTISTIALALKTFGHKHVPLKPILKEVAKMFEDSNAKVREEAQKLMIEMYRWAGAALKPTVDTLRPAQAKDLNTAFEALPQAKAVPEKRLRCEQPQDEEEEAPAGRGAGGGGGGEDEDEEAGGMDAYELAEPVDILSKLPGDWYDKVASTKWKERNEQMDVLLSLLNTPRLQPGDYRELTKTIKKIIDKDANVTVVMKAAQAAGLLAKGLRQAYSADAKYLVSTLLAKFKEKKANVVTAIHEALDAMMDTCFALTDLAEDLPAAADAKTPPGREQTLAFILRFIVKSKRASVGQAIKLLGPLLLKAMDDSTPEVREAAYKAFGTLVGKVGERPLSPYLTKLDGIKEKKVKENYPEKIFTGTLNLNPQAAAAKPAAAANGKPVAAAKKPTTANGKPAAATATATANGAKRPAPAATSSKPPASSQPPKPAAPKPEPAAAVPPPKPAASAPKPVAAKPKPKPKPQPVIPVELPLITPEEAMEKATAVLADTTLPLLEDAQWKNRVAGMEELIAQLDKLLEKDDALMVQVILRLVEQKPGFKDANFLVMQKVLHTITRLAKSQFFTKPMAELVLAVLVDKIADIKLRLVALECLNGVVEAVGLDFVLREVYKHATESKNPKAANEVLSWITTAIEDFGIQGPPAPVDVKLLVEFVKTLLEHSNAMVRSSATKAVTKIFTFVGEAIKEHLGDVKPALMTTIEKEFAKYANAKPDPPTKFYRQKEAVAPVEEEEEEEPEPEPVAEEPAAVELELASTSVRTTAAAAPSRAASRPAPAAAPASVDDGWVEGSIDEYDDGQQQEENAPPARADVTPLLTPALFAELADPKDWKKRKEALDKIRRILSEANMRVQSGCLALLMPKLNARLKDTNKNLVLYTVKLLGLLATAVGREIEGQMKLTVPLVLANYTDQKQTMRDTVAKTLDQWAAEVGADAFVPFFPAAVAIESSSARKDALAWLVAHKQELGKKSDVRVLLRPAVAALQDKTKEVRDLAEALLMHLFARVDVESIRAVCKELPQAAVRQQVVALAKKARGSVSASGSNAGSTTSSNDGSEKSVASSASSRSTGSVAPGSVKPQRSSSSTTKATATDKSSSTTTSGSTEVRTRRPSATTASSSLSRESKPQLTRGEAITPLVANEDKAKRQRQDKDHITVGTDDQARGGGWSFKTAPRPEHAQHLQQQARPYLSEALHAKMFSRDFRKHREALQELTAAVDDHPAATQQNADLLLKWASLRLFDANTSTQAKTLTFVEHLFRALDARDYQLTDYEAGVILPALLECLGQGEAMQEGIDALLKLVPRVYPSSKFFAFLLHAGLLGSKSPRTRAECLELMAGLVRRQGLAAVCPTPSAAFPQIAQFVTDKVSAVRNAALGLIQQAHLHAGDDLWLYTGSLNDTQRALIDQKLSGSGSASSLRSSSSGVAQPSAVKKVMQHKEEDKRSSRSSSPSATAHKAKAATSSSSSSVGSLGSSKTVVGVRTTASSSSRATASRSSRPASDDGSSPGPSSAAPQSPQSFSLELDKLQPVKSAKAPRAAPAALEPTTPVAAAAAEPTSSAGSSVVIEAWVKELESGDVDKMIGVCKAILERLAEGVTPFVGCSDGLVQTLAGLLNSTLRQKDFSIDRNREFKYFVNVLFKLFTHAPLAIGISRDASKCVLHSLMVAFVDPLVVPRSDTDTANNLYKGIQLATMKVLRNTDQTAIFTTLLEMLDDVLLGAGGESLPKGFAEVLIKALAIAVQHIKETIDEMNLDQVLRDLNAFLEAYHGRAGADDADDSIKAQMRQECVRLCHAAVKEIVAIKGRAGVSRHLSLVPVTKYPTPALVRVINKVLRDTFGAGGEATTAAPEGVRPEQAGEEDVDAHLAAKIELRQIMQRLASSERQQAIKDLYHFKCRHPDIDVQPYLATATTQFQTYVRRALMAVEEKENMPVRPDPANAAAPAASSGSEDVYMDKLRALQKRYGHTAGNKHGASASSSTLLSLASSTDSTAASASAGSSQLPSLPGTAAKPGLPSPANGASIQDLRLRLNTVLRTAGVTPATPTHHQAPSAAAADVSTPSPSPSSAASSDLASAPSYAALTPVGASAAAAPAVTSSPSSATLDVLALKERLARIKQTAAK